MNTINLSKITSNMTSLFKRYSKAWLDEIIEIMVDVVCSNEPYIRINKQEYPQEVVKSRFLKINSSHIEYIYDSLHENTSNVRNIRAFLLRQFIVPLKQQIIGTLQRSTTIWYIDRDV